MEAGKLKNRITIQTPVESTNDLGELSIVWNDVIILWCKWLPVRGKELVELKQVKSEFTARVYIRFITGLDTKMRVLYNGDFYNILSITDVDNAHREIEMIVQNE